MFFVALPALALATLAIPRAQYIVEADSAPPEYIYGALMAPPVEPLPRAYTLDEIRYSPEIRDRMPRVDLAIPAFGYKNHIGIDRRHRLIRRWTVTDAARHDEALLPELIDTSNTAGDVWADTAYRSLPRRTPAAFADPSQKAQRQVDAAP